MQEQKAMSKGSVMLTCGATIMMFLSQFVPSGLYANINGQELYLGDFTQDPDPQCLVPCSMAIRTNGKLMMVLTPKKQSLRNKNR